MFFRYIFGFKVWQFIITALALIVAGGWAIVKVFEYIDKALAVAD